MKFSAKWLKAIVKPRPRNKPRVERNRHVRLKRALAGRASLAGDGTRTVAPATG